MRTRWKLVVWFLANVAGWLWLTYESLPVLTHDDIASIALDDEGDNPGALRLQRHIGRNYRDAAVRANRNCRIAATLLGVDMMGICAVAIAWEFMRRRACGDSQVGGQD